MDPSPALHTESPHKDIPFSENVLRPAAFYGLLTGGVVLVIYLLDRFLNVPAESTFSWGFLIVAIILNRRASFGNAPGRFLFIFTVAVISFRYFLWRTFDTLIYTGPLDMIGMLLIYLAECYSLTIHFLGMFISLWPLESKPAPLPDDPSVYPSVDILIPTYTEDPEIIKLTVTAAMQIDYPRDKVNVYVLDDGSTDSRRSAPETSTAAWERYYELRRIARDLGARYLTRENNEHAKAGNINHALTKISGDLLLLLDCDHVPARDILKNTAGWFLKDPKLFLVQTPHFFINTTTVEKNIGSFSNAPGENDMFYHAIQPGMDLWNSAYFCGSAAVLRRQFLVDAGGIAGETITEDAETSLRLHNKGYNSVYIDRPMICGLSPETFGDYIVQRTRWAQGMVQIFVLNNPLFAKGLSWEQKMCYFNACFFWLFCLARFTFYLGPGLFLILGQKVYHASVAQIVAYALPHVLSVFTVMDFFYGRYRRRFFSEIYESVQALFLTPAVISAIFNPRKPKFKITPKGKTVDHEYLNPMATVFFMICLLNLIGIGFAAVKWVAYPLFRDVIFIAFVWCLYNLLLGLITLGAFWERQQLRQHHRVRSKGSVDVYFPDLDRTIPGTIHDLSLTGIGVELNDLFPALLGEDVRVEATDSYGIRHNLISRIRSRREQAGRTHMGIEFALDDRTYPDIVNFVYGDSKRWADILADRFKPVHSIRFTSRDLYHFMLRGARGSAERIAYLAKSALPTARIRLHALVLRLQAYHARMKRSESLP
ncbi:MAG: UDP-forming cellulose synthase catalytic subunit [Nitrospirota bacterium]|nr:UDP-forming cellulose synthase catalytic subunit [Nitrospirota bacterium]